MTSYIIHLCVYPKSRQFLTLSRFKRVFFSSVATYFLSSHVRSGANIVGYENIVLYIERALISTDEGSRSIMVFAAAVSVPQSSPCTTTTPNLLLTQHSIHLTSNSLRLWLNRN